MMISRMGFCVNRFFEIFFITPFGHALPGVRVDGAAPRGFLRFLSLTALWAEGCGGALRAQIKKRGRGWSRGLWYRPAGDEYKVSVTDSPFCVIWHDRHSADWLAALATPFPAAPDFPLFRGKNKAPLCCELLMKGLLFSALLSHRSAGGRWCRKAPKGGKPPEVADRRNAFHDV